MHVRGTHTSTRITWWRLALFLAGLLTCVILYQGQWYQTGNAALGLFLAAFIVVARYHTRLEDRLHRLRLWQEIKRTHVARVRLDWPHIPESPAHAADDHAYAKDLDVTGPRSLMHVIDTTVSSHGRARLLTWLLAQPPLPAEWHRRHALCRELTRLPLLRDRLVLQSRLIDNRQIDGERVTAALSTPAGFPSLGILVAVESLLAATTLGLLLLDMTTSFGRYWAASLALYVWLYFWFSGRFEESFERAVSVHLELEQLGSVLGVLESRSYGSTPALADLCRPLQEQDVRPSKILAHAARIMNALSVKAHPLVHLAINVLAPWDLIFTLRLQRLQDRVRTLVPIWLAILADCEAASALATLASLHTDMTWPSPLPPDVDAPVGSAAVQATALGHPLIPIQKRIANDLTLEGVGHLWVVTGSNMSGKSTFLRTIGINVCLAQAGGPVCASAFSWTWVRLACCIRIDDSLDAGLSFFYAEVKQLKRLLDAAQDRRAAPVLFLIDEIFKGTNNRERLIGSRAYLRSLVASHGFGLVTTHDLELADLDRELPTVQNRHFQETVSEGRLSFDYRLRLGPCPTTNALRIMQLEGLPIEDQ
jgi:hypothetical protein